MYLIKKFTLLVLMLMILLLYGCNQVPDTKVSTTQLMSQPTSQSTLNQTTQPTSQSTSNQTTQPTSQNFSVKDKEDIVSICERINADIEKKEYDGIARYAHPQKGIRFSLYGRISTDNDLVFMPVQIQKFSEDINIYSWGAYEGSGLNIELGVKEYLDKFIYIEDFSKAKEIGYNKAIKVSGYPDNLSSVYPNAYFVEYYFPGINPDNEGFDWKSIKYVFEKEGTIWYLVGIIENQWTI